MHFVNRDSLGLANDFLSLGFIPEGVEIQSVSDALKASFGDGARQSQDFQVCNYGLYTFSVSCWLHDQCNFEFFTYPKKKKM